MKTNYPLKQDVIEVFLRGNCGASRTIILGVVEFLNVPCTNQFACITATLH